MPLNHRCHTPHCPCEERAHFEQPFTMNAFIASLETPRHSLVSLAIHRYRSPFASTMLRQTILITIAPLLHNNFSLWSFPLFSGNPLTHHARLPTHLAPVNPVYWQRSSQSLWTFFLNLTLVFPLFPSKKLWKKWKRKTQLKQFQRLEKGFSITDSDHAFWR